MSISLINTTSGLPMDVSFKAKYQKLASKHNTVRIRVTYKVSCFDGVSLLQEFQNYN